VSGPIVASAARWGAYYGIPWQWIVATIIVESRGNPAAVGDQGRSRGLMQINYGANTALLQQLGVTPDQLFDPDTNVRVGTAFMRAAYDRILKALSGRQPPIPVDVLLRLYYRGPSLVLSALAAGRNPLDSFSDGQVSASNWRAALNQTSAVV
jgi:soluble lytic murein transglycosylase-like protein